jgi:hypothetical protein
MGLTLDTGALVALERRDTRVMALIHAAQGQGRAITVSAPVVVEWWRGQKGPAAHLLTAFYVEPLGSKLARLAGAALANVKGASATDAVVMASAALRGDIVLTGDLQHLTRLQSVFPAVKLLRV